MFATAMPRFVVVAMFALALTGCGATAGDNPDKASATTEAPASASSAVERCTERLLQGADIEELSESEKEAVRHYTEQTYCARFAERGWVHDDGTLSIEAHTWLEEGGEEECAEAEAVPEGEPAKPARTVPCEQVADEGDTIIGDCALLRHVRRSEVRRYLEELSRERGGEKTGLVRVECEDGTPLEELGAP